MELINPRLRNKYDPEISYKKADEFATFSSKEEALQWWENPCTQEMIHRLEGDMSTALMFFLEGGYVNYESADNSALLSAKAQGHVQAIYDILETIESIKRKRDEQEEDQHEGLHSPN